MLKCDDIDDIFWKLYQSSDEEDKNNFADQAVKINPKTGKVMTMEEEIKAGEGNEKAKLAKLKKKFMFKKKVDISDIKSRYDKIQLILRLRILEGPLFIYA